MPTTTRLVGIVLMIIGLGSYWLTGRTSITALIPAFFGVVFVLLAYVARNEAARKHAMHAAVALGLLGDPRHAGARAFRRSSTGS